MKKRRDREQNNHSCSHSFRHISVTINIKDNVYCGPNERAGKLGIFLINSKPLVKIAGLSAPKRQLPGFGEHFWHGDPEVINETFRCWTVKRTVSKAMDNVAVCLANAAAFMDNDEIIAYCPPFSCQTSYGKYLKMRLKNIAPPKDLPH